MSEDIRKELYRQLKGAEVYNGDYASFTADIDKPKVREELYNQLSKAEVYNGTYEQFDKDLTGDKKRYSVKTNKGVQYFDTKEEGDKYAKAHYKPVQDVSNTDEVLNTPQATPKLNDTEKAIMQGFEVDGSTLPKFDVVKGFGEYGKSTRNPIMHKNEKDMNVSAGAEFNRASGDMGMPTEDTGFNDNGEFVGKKGPVVRQRENYKEAKTREEQARLERAGVVGKELADLLDRRAHVTQAMWTSYHVGGIDTKPIEDIESLDASIEQLSQEYTNLTNGERSRLQSNIDGVRREIDTIESEREQRKKELTPKEKENKDLLRSYNKSKRISHDEYTKRHNELVKQIEGDSGLTSQMGREINYNLTEAEKLIKLAEKNGKGAGYFTNLWAGFSNRVMDTRLWDLGIQDLTAYYRQRGILQKYEDKEKSVGGNGGATIKDIEAKVKNGKKVSRAEELYVKSIIIKAAAEDVTQYSLGKGYQDGTISAEALPFMMQFGIFDALGNTVKGTVRTATRMASRNAIVNNARGFFTKGMEKAEQYGAKLAKGAVKAELKVMPKSVVKTTNKLVTKAGQFLGKQADYAFKSALMTGTVQGAQTAGKTIDYTTGKATYEFDDNGNIYFTGVDADTRLSAPEALAKATYENTKENFTEMGGGIAGAGVKLASKPITKAMKLAKVDKYLDKVAQNVGGDVYNKVRAFFSNRSASSAYQKINKFFKTTQWHGTFGEYWEEVEGNVLDAIANKATNGKWGDGKNFKLDLNAEGSIFNLEDNIDTFRSLFWMGAATSSVATGAYMKSRLAEGRNIMPTGGEYLSNIFGSGLGANIASRIDALYDNGNTPSAHQIVEVMDGMNDKEVSAVLYYVASKEQELAEQAHSLSLARDADTAVRQAIDDEVQEQAQQEKPAEEKREIAMSQEQTAQRLDDVTGGTYIREQADKFLDNNEDFFATDLGRSLDDETKEAVMQYFAAVAQLRAIEENDNNKADEAVQAEQQKLQNVPTDANGNITTITRNGIVGYVVKQDGDNITYISEEGDVYEVKESQIDRDEDNNPAYGTINLDEHLNEVWEQAHEQQKAKTLHEMQHHQNTPSMNDLRTAFQTSAPVVVATNNGLSSMGVLNITTMKDGTVIVALAPIKTDKDGNSVLDETKAQFLNYEELARLNDEFWDSQNSLGAEAEDALTTPETAETADENETEIGDELPPVNGETVQDMSDTETETDTTSNETQGAITYNEEGEPNFDNATTDEAAEYFNNEDSEVALPFIDNFIADAKKNLDTINRKKPDVKKYGTKIGKFKSDLAEWQSAVDEAQTKVNYWNEVKSKYQRKYADELKEENKKKQTLAQRLAKFDLNSMTWQDYVLATIAAGLKFKGTSDGSTKGLAEHLTGRGTIGKDINLVFIDNTNGEYPEVMAQKIWEGMPQAMKERITDQDVFNEILDIMLHYPSYNAMIDDLDKRYDESAMQSAFDKADYDAWAEEQGYEAFITEWLKEQSSININELLQDYADYYARQDAERLANEQDTTAETGNGEMAQDTEQGTDEEDNVVGDSVGSTPDNGRAEEVGQSEQADNESGSVLEDETGDGGVTETLSFDEFVNRLKQIVLSLPSYTVFEVKDNALVIGNKKSAFTFKFEDYIGNDGKLSEEFDFLKEELQNLRKVHEENVLLSQIKRMGDEYFEEWAKLVGLSPMEASRNLSKESILEAKQTLSYETILAEVVIPFFERKAQQEISTSKEQPHTDTNKTENTDKGNVKTDSQESQSNDNVETDNYTITKQHHDKADKDIWVVRSKDRADKDTFTANKKKAKENNGYYSSFKGVNGFVFDTLEDAEAFAKDVWGEENPLTETTNSKQASKTESKKSSSYTTDEDTGDVHGVTLNPLTDSTAELHKGEKWNSTDKELSKYQRNRKVRHDAYVNIGGKKYGLTIADAEMVEYLLDEYGDAVSVWNAYENGKIMLSPEIASVFKTYLSEAYNTPLQNDTHDFKVGDKVMYKGKEVKITAIYIDGRPVVDDGMGLLHTVANWEDVSRIEDKEETPIERMLTADEIDASSVDDYTKLLAKEYLKGDTKLTTTAAYNRVLSSLKAETPEQRTETKKKVETKRKASTKRRKKANQPVQGDLFAEQAESTKPANETANETTSKPTNEALAKEERDKKKKELAEKIKARLAKAKNSGKLYSSVIPGISPEKLEAIADVLPLLGEYGKLCIEDGYYTFKEWAKVMFKELKPYVDGLLDNVTLNSIIGETWNNPVVADGKVLLVSQWAEQFAKDAAKQNNTDTSNEENNVSLQQPQTSGDISNSKSNNNGKETDVQPRSAESGSRGQQPNENGTLGGSTENGTQQPVSGGMDRRNGAHSTNDENGNRGMARTDASSEDNGLVKKNQNNNRAERGMDYAPKSPKARYDANIKAIKTLLKIENEKRNATPQEMETLRKYSGWGGLGGFINNEAQTLIDLIGVENFEAAANSANSAYFTPAKVIDALWDIAEKLGFKGGKILEGSAGIGNILGLMPQGISDRSNIRAVEIDNLSSRILSVLYPDAKVDAKGFEETQIDNNSIDLAITNVPFVPGQSVHDETGDKDLSRRFKDIHNFCIAKNIRKLKQGGIGIFITTRGTLDKSKALRQWITSEGNADVVGAFRLNSDTFGGTNATSDIIIVRKRVNGQKSADAIDVSTVSVERTAEYHTTDAKGNPTVQQLPVSYNSYFVQHPWFMGGIMRYNFEDGDTFRETSMSLKPSKDIDQMQRLAEWVETFDKQKKVETVEEQTDDTSDYEDVSEDVKHGTLLVNSKGEICIAQKGKAVPLQGKNISNKVKGQPKAKCLKDYNAIKTALADVLKYQTEHEDDKGLAPLLKKLNSAYDNFVRTYGHFYKNTALSFLKSDVDYSEILGLESVKEVPQKDGSAITEYKKAEVFNNRVIGAEKEPTPSNVEDAISASIHKYGRIAIDYIAHLLGKAQEEIHNFILDNELGYIDPQSGDMVVSYQYLSGDVLDKLEYARENNTDGKYDKNIAALEKVLPMQVPSHLINISLGATWVPVSLYTEYIKEKTARNIIPKLVGGKWVIDTRNNAYGLENHEFGVRSEKFGKVITGVELISAAMNNGYISVTQKNGDITETDKEATQACQRRIGEIKDEFRDWARDYLQSHEDVAKEIEDVYNHKFNNYVQLTIPDKFVPERFIGSVTTMNGKPFKLYAHQAKAVIKALTHNTLFAHEVGTGKTFTLITTAMEMKRIGTAKKPMIVVQNATLGQFVQSAKQLYPNAKVLAYDESDKGSEGRRNFYANIRYNDWDMIIIPQSVLEKIPDSEARQAQYIQDKIDEKLATLEAAKELKDNRLSSSIQKEIDSLQDELSELNERTAIGTKVKDVKRQEQTKNDTRARVKERLDRAVDEVVDFDQMGIDALLVDEAHNYKHLGFATSLARGIRGVSSEASKRSQSVFLKCQAVMDKSNGKNVVFATGTPISNTAAEIWTFLKYLLSADKMKQYDMQYFDDFIHNFGRISQMSEFTTSGKFKEVSRFAGYENIPELMRRWQEVTDTRLSENIEALQSKLPDTVESSKKPTYIYLPQTPTIRRIMSAIRKDLEWYEGLSKKEKDEHKGFVLQQFTKASMAAIDPRLVASNAPDEAGTKTNRAVDETLKALEESKDYNGTVAIFCDSYQNKNTGFNLYEDIKQKLVARGVQEDEIFIVKSDMSQEKKLRAFEDVNKGKIRVILGSTSTLGTGVNIQERLYTEINLDVPSRPMDMTQRVGRILRQGNMHKDWNIPVKVLNFGIEDTLDVSGYQRLKTKSSFIDVVMHNEDATANNLDNRTYDEEEEDAGYGDAVANLSGSEYAILKNSAERTLRRLQSKKQQHEADQRYIKQRMVTLTGQIATDKQNKERFDKALNAVSSATDKTIKIGKHSFATIDSMEDFIKNENKKKNEVLADLKSKAEKSGYRQQAQSAMTVNVGGFDFEITTNMEADSYINRETNKLDIASHARMYFSCEQLGIKGREVERSLLKNALVDIADNIISGKYFEEKSKSIERAIEHEQTEYDALAKRQGRKFEQEEELAKAQTKVLEYEEKMKVELEAKEKKYAELDKQLLKDSNASDIQFADIDEDESDNTKQSRSVSTETTEQDAMLRDALADIMREAGIDVITDSKEGQETLDAVNDAIKPHKVYHGSGADFDAFDHSHMGEGEGAQMYGWGTYVTEVEGIGRGYAIASAGKATYNGKIVNSADPYSDSPAERALFYIEQEHGRKEAIKFLREIMKDEDDADIINDYKETIKVLQDEKNWGEPERILYTVDIPDNDGLNYLDWDKMYSKAELEDITNALVNATDLDDVEADDFDISDINGATEPYGTGQSIIRHLEDKYGAKEAAKALSEIGFVGVVYPAEHLSGGREDNAMNYVIFDESNLKINNKERFFRTSDGSVYGFTKGGKIYLDPRIAGSETAVHEYTHLWAEAVRKNNPELWNEIRNIFENDKDVAPLWDKVKKDYPELSGDELLEEVIAHYSGKQGSEKLNAAANEIAKENGGKVDADTINKAINKVRTTLNRFWDAVKSIFNIKERKASDIADMALRDLLNGVKPNAKSESVRFSNVEDNPFVRKRKSKAAANLFRANSLEEFPSEVQDYIESHPAITSVIGDGNAEAIYDYLMSLNENDYRHATKGNSAYPVPTYAELHNMDKENAIEEIEEIAWLVKDNVFNDRLTNADWLMDNMPELVQSVRFNDNTTSSEEVRRNMGFEEEAGIDTGDAYIDEDSLEQLANKQNDIRFSFIKHTDWRDEVAKGWKDRQIYGYRSKKETSDIQYEKAKDLVNALAEAGYKDFHISRSITDFGVSTYIQGALGLKFRISDHSVTNTDRMFGEEHLTLATNPQSVVDIANERQKQIASREERIKAERKAEEERKQMLDEKWERIKDQFEGYYFKSNDTGTYAHFDEEIGKHPNSKFLLQKSIPNNAKKWRYEWAEPLPEKPSENASFYEKAAYDTALSHGKVKPSYDFIEAWDENASDVNTSRFSHENNNVPSQSNGIDRESDLSSMATAVESLADELHTPVNVLTSEADLDNTSLPDDIKRQMKENGNGLYYNGKVYVYLPNCEDVNDAVKVTLHEVVGHGGLRKMLGEQGFNDFCHDLYRSLPKDTRSMINERALLKYGGDIYEAMDEYLAEMAERNETPTWWEKVIARLRQALRKTFGMDIDLSVNDAKYLVWQSKNQLKKNDIFSYAAQITMRRKLGINHKKNDNDKPTPPKGGGGIRWSSVTPTGHGTNISPSAVQAAEHYNRSIRTLGYVTSEAFQDSMQGLKNFLTSVMEASKKKFEDIKDWENPYIFENHMASINEAEFQSFNHLFAEPLMKTIVRITKGDYKQAYNDMKVYMMAKHGLERNEVFAERDAKKDIKYDKRLKEIGEAASKQIDFDNRLKNATSQAEIQALYDELDNIVKPLEKALKDELNNKIIKYREHDYSGLTSLFADDVTATDPTLADYEKAAKDYVDAYESSHDADLIKDLWDNINACNAAIIAKQREGGLITSEQEIALNTMFKYYIPLRGFDETTSDEVYDYLLHDNSTPFSKVTRTAKGRKSIADDPIATMANMAENSITSGNRNKLKQMFMHFILNHPSDAAVVTDVYYHKTTDEQGNEVYKILTPQIEDTDDIDTVNQKVAYFKQDMEEKCKNQPDEYVKQSDKPTFEYRTMAQNKSEHQVTVFSDGKQHTITITGDPRAAQAINGLTNPEVEDAKDKIIMSVTRWIAQVNTTLNPEFVVSNFARDTWFAGTMVWVRENYKYALKYDLNWWIALGRIWGLTRRFNQGKLDLNNEWDKMFHDFVMGGGRTGYTAIQNIEKHKQLIQDALSLQNGGVKSTPQMLWNFITDLVKFMNESVENIARFATFVTSRQMGRTMLMSVHDAKQVSVNFNKKGAGYKSMGDNRNKVQNTIGLLAGLCRLSYVFFNAGVQGMQTFSEVARKHPFKFSVLASLHLALPILVSMLNEFIAGDDDDEEKNYWNLPDYERRNNICIFDKVNGFIKIPLPIELRAIYGLGDIFYGNFTGKNKTDVTKTAQDVTSQLMQLAPIDPLSENGFMELVPTVFRPEVELFANQDWTGKPIYKDSEFDEGKTRWQKAFSNTNPMLVGASKKLVEWTGDNAYDASAWGNARFLDPSGIEHLLNGYFGGVFNFFSKTSSTVYDAATGEDINLRRVPFASRFYSKIDEAQMKSRLQNYYYGELDDRVKRFRNQKKGLENEIIEAKRMHDVQKEAELITQRDKLLRSNEVIVSELYKRYGTPLKRLKEAEKQGADVDYDVIHLIKSLKDTVSDLDKAENKK